MTSPRQWLKRAALAPLRCGPVRSRLAFWLHQEHYPELEINVPLSHGLVCPIYSPEYWCSFSEIFVHAEYARAFDFMPLPDRWLDLGCHAGFFSLYVEWRRRKAGSTRAPECLLMDADARLQIAVERLAAANQAPFRFLHGGIGAGADPMRFTERAFMASSAAEVQSGGGTDLFVPTRDAVSIGHALGGPYDLIKVDIEGSEFDFLRHYGPVLKQTRSLLLEWHSWHPGGGGRAQLEALVHGLGFELKAEVQAGREVAPGKFCGVLLFANSAPASGGT